VPNRRTPGDLFFEDFCATNGYVATYEPDWRALYGVLTAKAPDFLLERGGDRAIVEVKHFTASSQTERLLAAPGRALSFGGIELYGTLRSSIRAAAEEQLAPFADVGVPLAVVVTNPLRSDVSFDPDDVVSALLGEVRLRVTLEPGGPVQPVFTEEGAVLSRTADGRLKNRIPHLSAVVAVYGLERFPRVDVYDLSGAPGFTGTPLPRTMFDGDDDRWLGFTEPELFGRLDPP
jgi:hypothetical protein